MINPQIIEFRSRKNPPHSNIKLLFRNDLKVTLFYLKETNSKGNHFYIFHNIKIMRSGGNV
ncbi:hypothetical protein B1H10_08645 [candidate division KSB1 bacterium 4484_188]|nr:MAG: hypothetical protein B1H10_08645 [candidate division KSB1 bacterium 4484_188]